MVANRIPYEQPPHFFKNGLLFTTFQLISLCQEKQGQRQGKLNFNLCQTQHTENQAVGPLLYQVSVHAYMHTCTQHTKYIRGLWIHWTYQTSDEYFSDGPKLHRTTMGFALPRSGLRLLQWFRWDVKPCGVLCVLFLPCLSFPILCVSCPYSVPFFCFALFLLSCELRRDDKRWQQTRRDEKRWGKVRRDEKRWDCTHLSHLSLFVSPVILFCAAFQPLLPEYGGSRQRKKKTGIRRGKQHWEKVQEARQCDLINLQLVFQSASLLVALTLVVKSWSLV